MKKTALIIMLIVWGLFTLFTEHDVEEGTYREKALISLKSDFKDFQSFPSYLKNDESFLKEALKVDAKVFQYFPKKYKENKEWVLLAVKENGLVLEYVSNLFKSDEDVVTEAIEEDGYAFKFAHEYLKKDRTYVEKLLNEKEFIFDHIDKSLQEDQVLIEKALKYDGSAFEYLSENFKKNRAYIVKLLKKNGWIFSYIDEKFKKDKELIAIAIENAPAILEEDVPEEVKKDKDFLFSLIKINKEVVEYIDKKTWEDNDFLLKVLKETGYGLQYATKQQQNDIELVVKAIANDGFALAYASEELKKDKALVLKAIESYSDPLKYADSSLQNDRAFIKKAIEVNAFAITSVESALKSDRELQKMAVMQNTYVLDYLPELKKDKAFMLDMINEDINVVPFIDESLKDDSDIVEAIEHVAHKYKYIEELFTWVALALFMLFLYLLLMKHKKNYKLLIASVLLLIVVKILQTYFVHGVFRISYEIVDKSHKFGLKQTHCWMGEEPTLSSLECYDMYVPEIYNDINSNIISFPVRVFRSSEIFSTKAPLLHLGGGGPGAQMALDNVYALSFHLLDHDDFSLNQGRDFFIIDPRGAGLSEPLLTCDTFVDNFLLNMKKDLTLEESYRESEQDYAKCIQKFKKAKINFNGYNSEALADDIHTLSQATSVDKWVLFGVSYSTTYAMFVAKKYPDIVKAMILDSSCFPDLKRDYNYRMQVMDRYNALYKYKDKVKNKALLHHPDMNNSQERIWSLYEKLNKNPIEIDYLDLKVNGNYFISSLLNGVYGTKIFEDLEDIILEMEQNNTKHFLPYFESYIDFLMDREYADVSAMAHYCYEDKPFINFSKIKKAQDTLPKGFIKNNAILAFKSKDFCKEMNISSNNKTLAEPIKTEIPTLFIHGEFDSVTPLRDVKKEMKNFKHSKLLTYKTSHATLGTEPKIERDVAKFLEDF